MLQQAETVSQPSASERTDSAGQPPRTVRRRRGLPGSRAVVGGLLVAAAAVGMFAAASSSGAGRTRSYVVARHELAPGTRLQAGDLELAAMELPPTSQGRVFTSSEPLLGATLVAPLGAGELVQSSAVVARAGDTASRELSFTVERGRLSPGVKQGERADLLATYGSGTDAYTVAVVRQAHIVGLERPRTSTGENGPATVTVAVEDPNDALALAHAVQLGKVTVVRATGAPPLPGVPPTYRTTR
jgi:hypothetical protein